MGADYKKAPEAVIMGGTQDNHAQNSTDYYFPQGIAPSNGFISPRRGPISSGGVLEHLYVRTEAAPGAGETYDVTLYLNGVITAMTVEIAGAAQIRGFDLVTQIGIIPGDELTIEVASSALAVVTRLFWSIKVRT